MTIIALMNGGTLDSLGLIPFWLDPDDPRPAREQLNEHYAHGGGWRPQAGFKFNKRDMSVRFPGDPPFRPIAMMKFRDEKIIAYQYAYFMILQKDGSFEICRMD